MEGSGKHCFSGLDDSLQGHELQTLYITEVETLIYSRKNMI